jgi:hypothetical protein
MKHQPLFPFLLIFVFSACTTVADVKSESPTRPTPSPTLDAGFIAPTQTLEVDSTQMTQPAQVPRFSDTESLIEKATEDLAQQLSISISQIHLEDAKEVIWPDASLGCPQPGMMYAQIQTAGYLIKLETNNKIYEYHTDMDNTVILCESTSEEKNPNKDTDKNVQDGWPNQTKDKGIDILKPTREP